MAPRVSAIPSRVPQVDHPLIVIGVKLEQRSELFLVVRALGALRAFSGLIERGQQHRREDRNDRNHHYDNLLNIQYGVY